MGTMKVPTSVAIVTVVTLALQLIILFRTQCHVDVRSLDRIRSLNRPNVNLLNRTSLFHKTFTRTPSLVDIVPDAKNDVFPVARSGTKRRLTIGIPTIKRRDGSYFLTMFETMFNKTSPEYLQEITFVIFLSEMVNVTWKQEMAAYLNRKYQKHVESGSIIVIEAPLSFYDSMPDFGNNSYMFWRTKQNFDYAYIMKYSQYLSEYYMQMEDDVITADDYYPAILKYINDTGHDNWVCMEFSELGFIGKLYHSRDLNRLATMFLIFNTTQPVDYTFIYFNILSGQNYKLMRKPTLFQHIGVASSLADKVQPLRDKYFDFPPKEIKGDNPEASITTSLTFQDDFPPELAYKDTVGYFWSKQPADVNDTFIVVFKEPRLLKNVVVVTGSKDFSQDQIYSAVVEASPDCIGYTPIGEFHSGIANITVETLKEKAFFNTSCMRIRFTQKQTWWVIIREIAVFI